MDTLSGRGDATYMVQSIVGTEPRFSISCNHHGDWQRFTNSKTEFQESTWTHEMTSRDGVASAMKLAKEKKNWGTSVKEKSRGGVCRFL